MRPLAVVLFQKEGEIEERERHGIQEIRDQSQTSKEEAPVMVRTCPGLKDQIKGVALLTLFKIILMGTVYISVGHERLRCFKSYL
jgi:hypothetical protein